MYTSIYKQTAPTFKTKTDHHNITEILLKMALITITLSIILNSSTGKIVEIVSQINL
jgi:hypothetical protein